MGMSHYLKAEDVSRAVDVDISDRKDAEELQWLPSNLFEKGFLKQSCMSAELKWIKYNTMFNVK